MIQAFMKGMFGMMGLCCALGLLVLVAGWLVTRSITTATTPTGLNIFGPSRTVTPDERRDMIAEYSPRAPLPPWRLMVIQDGRLNADGRADLPASRFSTLRDCHAALATKRESLPFMRQQAQLGNGRVEVVEQPASFSIVQTFGKKVIRTLSLCYLVTEEE